MSSIYEHLEKAKSAKVQEPQVKVKYDAKLDPMVGMPIAPPQRPPRLWGFKLVVLFSLLFSIAAAVVSFYLFQQLNGSLQERQTLQTRVKELTQAAKDLEASDKRILSQISNTERNVESLQGLQASVTRNHEDLAGMKKTVMDLSDRAEAMFSEMAKIKNKVLFDPFESDSASASGYVSSLPTIVSVAAEAVESTSDDSFMTTISYDPSRVVSVSNDLPSQKVAGADQASMFAQQPVIPAPIVTTSSVSVQQPSTAKAAPTANLSRSAKQVMTVNRKFNFIVVNIGLKDGLKMGDQLEVKRSGRSVARVEVEKLYDDFAAATIVNESSGVEIQEGDQIVQ